MYVIVTNHVNWHREYLRSDRENTGNLKMQFEWVPCIYTGSQLSHSHQWTGFPLHNENRKNGENGKKRNPCQGKHREFGNFAIRFVDVGT